MVSEEAKEEEEVRAEVPQEEASRVVRKSWLSPSDPSKEFISCRTKMMPF